MSVTLWVLTAMVFYAIGEYSSKEYANTSSVKFGVYAMIGYMINALCFLPAISKMNSLVVLGTIWNLGYVFITLFLGLVIFKETLTMIHAVGLVLGVISIILLTV
jgi:multidrug transporter EmrE-like cation transporter